MCHREIIGILSKYLSWPDSSLSRQQTSEDELRLSSVPKRARKNNSAEPSSIFHHVKLYVMLLNLRDMTPISRFITWR
jgi:hypothetical protein